MSLIANSDLCRVMEGVDIPLEEEKDTGRRRGLLRSDADEGDEEDFIADHVPRGGPDGGDLEAGGRGTGRTLSAKKDDDPEHTRDEIETNGIHHYK